MLPTSPIESNKEAAFPWKRLLYWETLFQSIYFFRSVSLEIWRASKTGEAVFEEMKFGETPLSTVRKILRHLPPLTKESLIYDLGCGRGRAAFFFHFLTSSKVIAIDAVPSFIATGRRLSDWCHCQDSLFFYCEDFRQIELEEADLIYACALCFGGETRKILLEKVLQGTPGLHLVSVGWRPEHPRLQQISHFQASFSWGPAWVSINRLQAV